MLEGWLTQHGHLHTQEIQIGKHIVSGTPHNFGDCVLYVLHEYTLKEEIPFSGSYKQKTGKRSCVECCNYDI